tara:strand:+ start:400 stop:738 length:339 start_codon:yes stop_codon:yes gene_type:complete
MSLNEKLTTAKTRLRSFAKTSPDLSDGFMTISKAANRRGTFTVAQKELIAAALAVTKGCDDCILYHVDAARCHGASEDALIEVLEVAVYMGGGPAVMSSGKALEAFRAKKKK